MAWHAIDPHLLIQRGVGARAHIPAAISWFFFSHLCLMLDQITMAYFSVSSPTRAVFAPIFSLSPLCCSESAAVPVLFSFWAPFKNPHLRSQEVWLIELTPAVFILLKAAWNTPNQSMFIRIIALRIIRTDRQTCLTSISKPCLCTLYISTPRLSFKSFYSSNYCKLPSFWQRAAQILSIHWAKGRMGSLCN